MPRLPVVSTLKLPGRAGGGAPAGLPIGTGRDPLSGAANPFRSSNRADNLPPRGNAREGGPFGLLPDEVDLGFKTDLAEALDTPIGPLAQSPMVNWNVTIDSSATSLEGLQYSVGAPEKQVAGVRWPIEITTRTSTGENTSQLLQSGEADSAALAYVVAANHQISIAGRPGSNHLQLSQLRNCVLSMSDGVHTKAVQLRRTEQHPVVAVDFQAKEVVINVDLPALPPKDKLLLELCPERPLSAGLQLDSKESRAPIGKELKVNLTKWPGAYLSLRLVTDHDAYAIKVRPRYVLRKQHADMTLDAVGKEIGRLTRQRNQNMRDLTVARGRLQQIPSDLRRAQSMPVRTVKDKSMKSAAIAVLQKEGNKMQAMVKRMASAIPQIEMALVQLNKLPPILRELQGKSELPLRVVAQRKEGVLVLLAAE